MKQRDVVVDHGRGMGAMWNAAYRKAVLSVAGLQPVHRMARRHGMKWGAARFVAAETLEEALPRVKAMNAKGLRFTLDYLGESVLSQSEADGAAGEILRAISALAAEQMVPNVSVKLTQLGLLLDEEACCGLMRRIVDRAAFHDGFVRIDMEDSSVTERTLRIFRKLADAFGMDRVGVVIQAYLHRSESDLRSLGELGANVRIVKGAYKEPSTIAYPGKKEVNAEFLRLVRLHLRRGCYTAVATHDRGLIEEVKRFVERERIPWNRLEFQMLYGVAESLQLRLAEEGYLVRVYTPFGTEWYPYFVRRIAERPANAAFVLKSLLRR